MGSLCSNSRKKSEGTEGAWRYEAQGAIGRQIRATMTRLDFIPLTGELSRPRDLWSPSQLRPDRLVSALV